jgi:hypothetical protein
MAQGQDSEIGHGILHVTQELPCGCAGSPVSSRYVDRWKVTNVTLCRNGASCKALGRFGDVFYQFSVTLGDAVVLERITEVVPWQLRARIGHCIAILIRLIIGMVDVPLASVYLSFEGGPCVYRDQPVVGALYTSLDTAISLYATIMTFLVLTWELRNREQEGSIPVHRYHYITIVTRYTAPVFCLTVVNMIGTIGNGSVSGWQEMCILYMIDLSTIPLFFIERPQLVLCPASRNSLAHR